MELSMTVNAAPLAPHDSRNPSLTATGAGLTTLASGAAVADISSIERRNHDSHHHAGKIGAEASRLLARRGTPVRVLVRNPEKVTALAPAGVDVCRGDLEVPAPSTRR